MNEKVNCELCGANLKGKASYDLWALKTIYEQDGTCAKTSLESGFDDDYLVVGVDCCGGQAILAWETMIETLRRTV